jgi:Macro domain
VFRKNLIERTQGMSFKIISQSIFDSPANAYVNTINCIGVMGAGIALEFKKRYPTMFADYQEQCQKHAIRPGDCYVYYNKDCGHFLLGLAVKNDWRHWSTLEWIESSIKSLKLVILENDIKVVNMPLPGGKNGRRGPYGKMEGFTPPPEHEELKNLISYYLNNFCNKFDVDINLCIPDEKVVKKEGLTMAAFID